METKEQVSNSDNTNKILIPKTNSDGGRLIK